MSLLGVGLWSAWGGVFAPHTRAESSALQGHLQALLKRDPALRLRAAEALRKRGQEALAPLMSWLRQGNAQRQVAAAFVLSGMGPNLGSARQSLLNILRKSRSAGAKQYLLMALSRLPKQSAPVLRAIAQQALRGRGIGVREAALEALLQTQSHPVGKRLLQEVLRKHLQAPDWRRRRQAAASLVRVRSGAVPLLQMALNDRHVRVQEAAALATSALGQKATPLFDRLVQMLSSPSWRLRYAAAEAFQQMGPVATPVRAALVQVLGDRNWGVRDASAHALAKIGPIALPLLRRAYQSTSVRQRLAVMETLGRMAPSARLVALSLALRGMRDRDGIVRYIAVRVIWQIGKNISAKSSVSRALRRALRDKDWRIVELALQTFAARTPHRAFPKADARAILATLSHAHPAVREAAVLALSTALLSAQIKAALQKASRDRHWKVRSLATQALRQNPSHP